ncbi:MAG TPA: group III truncated hemoglobin [Rhodothermales bacterium]|nr:group III truncated hemoglobin [Rhodothermales bacterium]
MLADIESEADIQQIVDAFYGTITDDPVLARFFETLDLNAHRPRMVAFWSSVVFSTGTYRGQPFEKHALLDGLEARHFDQWLHRFETTIDARFEGEASERMKMAATRIAMVFQSKLGLLAGM